MKELSLLLGTLIVSSLLVRLDSALGLPSPLFLLLRLPVSSGLPKPDGIGLLLACLVLVQLRQP